MADALLVALLAMVVSGGATVWVTLRVPDPNRLLVAAALSGMAVAFCVSVTVAAYRAERVRRLDARASGLEDEIALLVDDVLPAAASRLRSGVAAETVLAEIPRNAGGVHQEILRTMTREISTGERQRAATMAACANAAGRVQAMATSMLADLREMESHHSEEVLGDLLRLDHSTAQTGRLADSIAVLTGARSGRRWTRPIVMESILRGAMGRIRAYQRVRVHSASTAAVVGYAAEDVMHALAELMDNATRFSAPSEEVHVYVEELHTGVVVTIEDGGLGMQPQALERAEAVVSANEPLDPAKLSGTRLGLVVVGSLARKHKLHVYFRPSSRGGTGVVVRIPNQLVVHPREEAVTGPMPTIEAAASRAVAGGAPGGGVGGGVPDTSTAVLDHPEGELPKRPRGRTLSGASRPQLMPETQPAQPRSDLGARFSAFQQHRSTSRADQPADDRTGPAGEDDAE